MRRHVGWMALTCMLLAGGADAQPGPGRGPGPGGGRGDGGGGVCREDRLRLCKDAGDRTATRMCMQKNKAALSPACRERVEAVLAGKSACQADVQKYCADVRPGRGRFMACLLGRKADLQPACKAHVEARLVKIQERRAKRATGSGPAPSR